METLLNRNKLYAQILCDNINSFLHSSKTKVYAKIYDVQLNVPLNLVILHFGKEVKEIEIKSTTELKEQLHQLGEKIDLGIHERYYDNDKAYLIKPNKNRYWNREQAMKDASLLIDDIINMGNY